MQRTILRDLLVLLGVFGLIWLVFSLFSYPEDPQLSSIQKEEEMDNELMEHFEIISTHPNLHSRIREALSYKPAKDFEARGIELDWELIRAEL